MELQRFEREITSRVRRGETYQQISEDLRRRHLRGLSCRSVHRYCLTRDIHYRSGLNARELDVVISARVGFVGHSYGRRTMQGLLRAEGVNISQRRIGRSLGRVAPGAQRGRQQQVHRHLNPIPYRARFYGDKVHLDQNEKLVMFGVTYVLAVDGFSRKIVGMITIPIKNAITIYKALMKPLMETEGLWQQVRTDHGGEFALVATIQLHLSTHRVWQNRLAVIQSTSRMNHRVERLWPEVNRRINYPIKWVLVEMEANGEINMNDDIPKFCVSWTTITVLQPAIQNFILAWNSHRIPGMRGGVPNYLAAAPQTARIQANLLPSPSEAVRLHQNQGGRLSEEHSFGRDPLEGFLQLQRLRERDFFTLNPPMIIIFQDVLHGNGRLFRLAVQNFIRLTSLFARLLP